MIKADAKDMIVRCPQCQAVNPHEHQVGSKEVTCQRCGSTLLVWSAKVAGGLRTPHTVAVSIKTIHEWDPDSDAHPAERYVLALERRLMEYSHEREMVLRPGAPPRQWQLRRVLMVAVLALALTLGFTAAKFALNIIGPSQARAVEILP